MSCSWTQCSASIESQINKPSVSSLPTIPLNLCAPPNMKRANLILFGADQPLHSRSLNSMILFDCLVSITAFPDKKQVSCDPYNIVQTLCFKETPFITFVNRVDPDKAALTRAA